MQIRWPLGFAFSVCEERVRLDCSAFQCDVDYLGHHLVVFLAVDSTAASGGFRAFLDDVVDDGGVFR